MLAGPSWAADDGLVWISKLAFQSLFSVEVVSEAFPLKVRAQSITLEVLFPKRYK